MIGKAAGEARGLRHNWLGPPHLLLAVLSEPGPASEAMAEIGISYQRLAELLAKLRTVNGRRQRYIESKGTTMNPAAHNVRGWAQGYAAANGRPSPTPEDWVLAILYSGNGMVASLLRELDLSAAVAVQALRRHGVRTPDSQPVEDRPWRGLQEIEVPESEWQTMVDILSQKHPLGSEWRWGFNSRRDRPRRVQFVAEQGVDLPAIAADAHTRSRSIKIAAPSRPARQPR